LGGSPLHQYYGPTIDFMSRFGWRVVSPPLDWRLPIAVNGGALVALIRAEGALGPVSILAHSRGGLVARYALRILARTDQLWTVARGGGLGVPHQGTLNAVALLGGWELTVRALVNLLQISESFLQGGWPTVELNRVISTWPTVYELMPMPGNGWLDPD